MFPTVFTDLVRVEEIVSLGKDPVLRVNRITSPNRPLYFRQGFQVIIWGPDCERRAMLEVLTTDDPGNGMGPLIYFMNSDASTVRVGDYIISAIPACAHYALLNKIEK
jgi:hypothetical protein